MSEANDPKRPRVRPALFGAVGFLVIGVVIWVFAVRIGKDPSLGPGHPVEAAQEHSIVTLVVTH